MFWGLIIGVAVGYFFKPQLDRALHKVVRTIRDNRNNRNDTF